MKNKITRFIVLLLGIALFAGESPVTAWAYSYYDEEDENDYEDEEEDEDGEEDDTDGEIVDDEADDENGFTVFFDENGGDITSSFNVITVTYGEAYGELPTVTRTGFKFLGWYTKTKDGTRITESTICTLTDDQTLHAQWKSTGGYTITYVLDGGVNHKDNPDEYKKSSKKITLKAPSRTDFTFGGWYSDKAYKKQITSIPKGTTGNLKIYAKWLNNPAISKTSTSKNKVKLTWKKCSGALRYQVYQATSANGSYKACATVTSTSATISNLTYNKDYYYKISAVYEVMGKLVTTEKSAATVVRCTKGNDAGKPGQNAAGAANVSGQMVFYYNLDAWKFSYEERVVSCFCCSPAMVLHAMGYDCDPNKLYDVMGGVAYYPAKIQKKYGVKINQYNLTGKTEAARKQELYNYLAGRPQGIMIRSKNNPMHTEVAYLKDGVIKVNDPGLKNGECIDISKSLIKKYMNIDYIITFDK